MRKIYRYKDLLQIARAFVKIMQAAAIRAAADAYRKKSTRLRKRTWSVSRRLSRGWKDNFPGPDIIHRALAFEHYIADLRELAEARGRIAKWMITGPRTGARK